MSVAVSLILFMAGVCAPAIGQQSTQTPPPRPPSATETKESASGDTKEPITPKFIPNFAQITPTLYRGGQPKEGGFEELAKMGINIVVDLRGDRDKERKIVTGLGMQYVPMHWQCSFPRDHILAEFLQLLRDNPGKKVFVHCRLGDDRTAMMIAAYRMAEEGWTPERALEEMKMYGFNFAHRRLICPGLSHYEEHFLERFQKDPAFENLRSKQRTAVPEQPPTTPQPPTPHPELQSPPPTPPPSPQASGLR